jgi:hypothetical protein
MKVLTQTGKKKSRSIHHKLEGIKEGCYNSFQSHVENDKCGPIFKHNWRVCEFLGSAVSQTCFSKVQCNRGDLK